MKTSTYPVFVDADTAAKLNITEADGRPEDTSQREGVYVGQTDEVTTYSVSDWPNIPLTVQTRIIENANRQAIQDAKNVTRADVKTGGTLSLTAQREKVMREMTPETALTAMAEIQRLTKEIDDARLARKAAKGG